MKGTRFYFCLIAILLFNVSIVLAQQDAQFSQFMFLNSYINPAACGINNTTDIALIGRYQWAGNTPTDQISTGSQQSQLLTASTKIRQINSGVGVYIINDQTALLNNVNANLSYAYHIELGQDVRLSLGVRGGIVNQRIDVNAWRANDPIQSDPTLLAIQQNANSLKLDLGAGIWLNSPKYFAGISMDHINKPAVFSDASGISYIYRHAYITGGYNFRLDERWVLTPSAFIRSDLLKFDHTQIDLNATAHLNNDQFWGGLSYRSGEAMIAMVGIGLLKDHSLKVGFAFDLVVTGSSAKGGTSYELMLTYSKPVADIIPRPIIRTPRFRY